MDGREPANRHLDSSIFPATARTRSATGQTHHSTDADPRGPGSDSPGSRLVSLPRPRFVSLRGSRADGRPAEYSDWEYAESIRHIQGHGGFAEVDMLDTVGMATLVRVDHLIWYESIFGPLPGIRGFESTWT